MEPETKERTPILKNAIVQILENPIGKSENKDRWLRHLVKALGDTRNEETPKLALRFQEQAKEEYETGNYSITCLD